MHCESRQEQETGFCSPRCEVNCRIGEERKMACKKERSAQVNYSFWEVRVFLKFSSEVPCSADLGEDTWENRMVVASVELVDLVQQKQIGVCSLFHCLCLRLNLENWQKELDDYCSGRCRSEAPKHLWRGESSSRSSL